ncbi:kinase binding protein CGI-121-domain-containing protein [Nemania diffusa]|nr:kinase binding protein CGI-121-domain-containing protein [Nemania diffusa]
MSSNAQQPSESNIARDLQSLDEKTRLAPTAKRRKTDHQTQSISIEINPLSQSSTMSTSPILETLQLEHIPATYSVHVAVFRDVENAAFLHQQLLARNADFEYALIDAGVITSRLQVLSAVFKAITAQVGGTMKTPNVHSEIVWSLSPTNNIAESYRRYGITPASQDLVIVKVLVAPPVLSSDAAASESRLAPESGTSVKRLSTAQAIEEHLFTHVQGRSVPFADQTLEELTDWGRVRKYYKLNGVSWLDKIKDPAAKNREMNMLIMGGMALRGV